MTIDGQPARFAGPLLAGLLLLAGGASGCGSKSSTERGPSGDGGIGGSSAVAGSGGKAGGAPVGGSSGGGAGGVPSGGSSGLGGSAGLGGSSATDGGAGIDGRAGAGGSSGTAHDAGTDSRRAAGGSLDAATDVNQAALPALSLYLAGDSTVMDYGAGSAQEGWGQELGQFFINKVTINDEAIGGRSIQSFMYDDAANTVESSRWTSIQANIKAGDYLMVQFGTNDSSGIAGRAVTPADFETLLGTMAAAIKAKHATPILVTPSALQQWVGGKETNTRLGPYADAMRDLGTTKMIEVDDLNARSVELLNMIGQTAAMQIYIDGDKAHFTKYGATTMAQIVAQELRRIASPLAAYLK
jgi:lysophospholipase L1-like esterase